jgi:hypothetical protein
MSLGLKGVDERKQLFITSTIVCFFGAKFIRVERNRVLLALE